MSKKQTAPETIPQHERGTAKIADLKAAPYNPRKIDKASRRALGKSLARFGVVQDVVVNKRTGNIVGGHQRVDELRSMGQTEVPVVWVDLDDVDEKALNITLNSRFVSGEFDDQALAVLLAELQQKEDLNFAELRLDDLLGEVGPPKEEPVDASPQLGAFLYSVVVETEDETSQAALIERLEKEGWKCRALIS